MASRKYAIGVKLLARMKNLFPNVDTVQTGDTITIPKGTTLFHGTVHNFPIESIKPWSWFSTNINPPMSLIMEKTKDAGKYNRGYRMDPRVIEFETKTAIELIVVLDIISGDGSEVLEMAIRSSDKDSKTAVKRSSVVGMIHPFYRTPDTQEEELRLEAPMHCLKVIDVYRFDKQWVYFINPLVDYGYLDAREVHMNKSVVDEINTSLPQELGVRVLSKENRIFSYSLLRSFNRNADPWAMSAILSLVVQGTNTESGNFAFVIQRQEPNAEFDWNKMVIDHDSIEASNLRSDVTDNVPDGILMFSFSNWKKIDLPMLMGLGSRNRDRILTSKLLLALAHVLRKKRCQRFAAYKPMWTEVCKPIPNIPYRETGVGDDKLVEIELLPDTDAAPVTDAMKEALYADFGYFSKDVAGFYTTIIEETAAWKSVMHILGDGLRRWEPLSEVEQENMWKALTSWIREETNVQKRRLFLVCLSEIMDTFARVWKDDTFAPLRNFLVGDFSYLDISLFGSRGHVPIRILWELPESYERFTLTKCLLGKAYFYIARHIPLSSSKQDLFYPEGPPQYLAISRVLRDLGLLFSAFVLRTIYEETRDARKVTGREKRGREPAADEFPPDYEMRTLGAPFAELKDMDPLVREKLQQNVALDARFYSENKLKPIEDYEPYGLQIMNHVMFVIEYDDSIDDMILSKWGKY
jgi:hypothetical protein